MTESFDVLIVGGGATGAGLLRDLARRGLRCLLVEQGAFGSGTSGRYHGLLHSGGRYVVSDPVAARECAVENAVLRHIAASCIEDTGGWFVGVPGDPEAHEAAFPEACAAAGVDCDSASVADALRDEPELNRAIRIAYRVRDAALDPLRLIAANIADAEAFGGQARSHRRLVEFGIQGDRIGSAAIADVDSGTIERISVGVVVSAAGAWADRVAALARVPLAMSPTKGTMLVLDGLLTRSVINRCHVPGDGDIAVPIHGVTVLGTTDERVASPDDVTVEGGDVRALIDDGAKLLPRLDMRHVRHAYAGIRPLFVVAESEMSQSAARALPRAHAVIDHGAESAISNMISVVGGKLTTYRLMAEEAADLVCLKLGIQAACTTADEPLDGRGSSGHWAIAWAPNLIGPTSY